VRSGLGLGISPLSAIVRANGHDDATGSHALHDAIRQPAGSALEAIMALDAEHPSLGANSKATAPSKPRANKLAAAPAFPVAVCWL
jgi:hypothetical protein